MENKQSGGSLLVSDFDIRSPISEAYRILQTNLSFKNLDGKYKVIAVTSSLPKEGKSTTSTNLALTLARAGKRVLLVDVDLRKPSIHKIFGLNSSIGLTNLLVEGNIQSNIRRPFPELQLGVLTSGVLPPEPSEILSTDKFKLLLDELSKGTDFVILDCPPVLGLNDTLVVSPLVDGFVLVVGSGRVSKKALAKAKQQLADVGAKFIGLIVNNVEIKENENSYYYSEYYRQRK